MFSEVEAAGGTIITGVNNRKGNVNYKKTSSQLLYNAYEITATPVKGYKFVNYTLSGGAYTEGSASSAVFHPDNPTSSTSNPLSLKVASGTVTVTANFEDLNLDVTKSPSNGGTVGSTKVPQVTTAPTSNVPWYYGLQYVLVATPADGYRFKEWKVTSGDAVQSDATVTVEDPNSVGAIFDMKTQDSTVQAVFEKVPHSITVTATQGGTASANGNKTSATLDETVGLTAEASDGYSFSHWEVTPTGGVRFDNVTNPTTNFVMGTKDVTIQAVFTQTPKYIAYFSNAEGGTAVMSSSSNLSNPSTALGDLEEGSTVYLQAIPNSGYQFKRWSVTSGNVTDFNNQNSSTGASFKMGANNVVIQPVFERIPDPTYSVTATPDNSAHGSASAEPSSNVRQNTTVQLTAAPESGYQFKYWRVDSEGISLSDTYDPNATFTMGSSDAKVVAVFEEIPTVVTYGVLVNSSGGGTAEADRSENLNAGDTVNLSATENQGYQFSRWEVVSPEQGVTLSSTTSKNASFTMPSSNVEINAIFDEIPDPTYSVTANVDDSTHGTATASPSSDVSQGTEVQLTAEPKSGYKFKNWEVVSPQGLTLNSTTDASTTFTMPEGNVTVKANFEEESTPTAYYTVEAQSDGNGIATANPSSNVTTGQKVQLSAEPESGYKFKNWDVISGGVKLSDATNANATFIMGSEDVVVQANFEDESTPDNPDNPDNPTDPDNPSGSDNNNGGSGTPTSSGSGTSGTGSRSGGGTSKSESDSTDEKGKNPDTGDPRSFTIWIFMIISLIGLGFSFFPRKKEREFPHI